MDALRLDAPGGPDPSQVQIISLGIRLPKLSTFSTLLNMSTRYTPSSDKSFIAETILEFVLAAGACSCPLYEKLRLSTAKSFPRTIHEWRPHQLRLTHVTPDIIGERTGPGMLPRPNFPALIAFRVLHGVRTILWRDRTITPRRCGNRCGNIGLLAKLFLNLYRPPSRASLLEGFRC